MTASLLNAMLGQVNRVVISSIDVSKNQLWVHAFASTLTKEGIAAEINRLGVEAYEKVHKRSPPDVGAREIYWLGVECYKKLHLRSPPPEGWDASMIYYGKLHGDGTVLKREIMHNCLSVASDYSLAKQTMLDWHGRTGVNVKQYIEYNSLTTGCRAGKVSKFCLGITESKEGLLNADVWKDSAGVVHARDSLNEWYAISSRSHTISLVFDMTMSSLVARTTMVSVLCSHEVITAFCSPRALYFSMNFYR